MLIFPTTTLQFYFYLQFSFVLKWKKINPISLLPAAPVEWKLPL